LRRDAPDVNNSGFASAHGKLRLDGVQLVDSYGFPVQLMGMSSLLVHGMSPCNTKESLQFLAEHWGVNLYRASLNIDDYISAPSFIKGLLIEVAAWCEELGIYMVVDWHLRQPERPEAYLDGEGGGAAIDVWAEMATLFKSAKHMLYEISNVPTEWFVPGTSDWATVKLYHDAIIPAVRAIDPETVLIVGTTTRSQDLGDIVASPVTEPYNVMYAFGYYAGEPTILDRLRSLSVSIPIFVSQWGTFSPYDDGQVYLSESLQLLDLLGDVNGTSRSGVLLSWAHWSYADGRNPWSALLTGSCALQRWDDTTCSGEFVRSYIKAKVETLSTLEDRLSNLTTTSTTGTTATSTTLPFHQYQATWLATGCPSLPPGSWNGWSWYAGAPAEDVWENMYRWCATNDRTHRERCCGNDLSCDPTCTRQSAWTTVMPNRTGAPARNNSAGASGEEPDETSQACHSKHAQRWAVASGGAAASVLLFM